MSNCLNNRLKHCLNFFYFATNCWCLLASAHASPEPSLHPVSGFSHINTHTHIYLCTVQIYSIFHICFSVPSPPSVSTSTTFLLPTTSGCRPTLPSPPRCTCSHQDTHPHTGRLSDHASQSGEKSETGSCVLCPLLIFH